MSLRDTASGLSGHYIPKNLLDCFTTLDSRLTDNKKDQIRRISEEEYLIDPTVTAYLNFYSAQWQLWDRSRLSIYFNALGIHYAEDMGRIIFDSYHRYLNGIDPHFAYQITYYKEWHGKPNSQELRRKKQTIAKIKTGSTVFYNFPQGFISQEEANNTLSANCQAKGIVREISELGGAVRVEISQSCDPAGLVFFRSRGYQVYNTITGVFENVKHPKSSMITVGQETWFSTADWLTYQP